MPQNFNSLSFKKIQHNFFFFYLQIKWIFRKFEWKSKELICQFFEAFKPKCFLFGLTDVAKIINFLFEFLVTFSNKAFKNDLDPICTSIALDL